MSQQQPRRSFNQRPGGSSQQQSQQQNGQGQQAPHTQLFTPQPGLPPPNAHPPGFGPNQPQPMYRSAQSSPSIFLPSPANITIDPKPVGPIIPMSPPLNQGDNMYNTNNMNNMNQMNNNYNNYNMNNNYNPSGMSGNTAYTALESQPQDPKGDGTERKIVPGRLTDTEIRVKVNGDLPLWFIQDKPKVAKYTKHMLHLFGTGVCVLVGKTHAYFLKILEAEMGDTPKHVKVMYSQVLFLRIGDSDKDESDKPKVTNANFKPEDAALTYYSWNEGETLFKTGDRGETHVLLDHFFHLKKQPNKCVCGNQTNPCKCMNEAKRLVLEDPSSYQEFPGTTGKC